MTTDGRYGEDSNDASGSMHGGTAVGAVFIVLAIGLNFLLDGMGEDEVAELPWFIALAFESGGKLGVTLVLCTIGVLFIGWDVLTHRPSATTQAVAAPAGRSRAAARPRTKSAVRKKDAPPRDEPVAEEIGEDEPEREAKKAPTSRGPFGGGGRPAKPAEPADEAKPERPRGNGAVVLSTAKYLNTGDGGGGDRDGLPDFRKGRTLHTRTED